MLFVGWTEINAASHSEASQLDSSSRLSFMFIVVFATLRSLHQLARTSNMGVMRCFACDINGVATCLWRWKACCIFMKEGTSTVKPLADCHLPESAGFCYFIHVCLSLHAVFCMCASLSVCVCMCASLSVCVHCARACACMCLHVCVPLCECTYMHVYQ